MKIRSLYELEEALDNDLAWRKREFSLITGMVEKANGPKKDTLLRAAITLMYSHWEGHIKKSAEIYITYLNCLGHKYLDMKDNFGHLSLSDKFEQGFSIKRYTSQKEVFDYIQSGLNCSFKVNCEKIIDTESNLKSHVILNLLSQLGLDTHTFELKKNFIDKKLLKNRNSIAHGDRVDKNDLLEAYSEIERDLLHMIETLHTYIRNAASNKEYLK